MLGTLGENSGSGSHIETPLGGDVAVVVDYLVIRLFATDHVGLRLVCASALVYACGAMRFVADDQIQLRSGFHSLFDFGGRMISAENHLHHAVCHRFGDFLSDFHRVGGDWNSQSSDIVGYVDSLGGFATCCGVGTDA